MAAEITPFSISCATPGGVPFGVESRFAMSDDAAIRRANLLRLCKARQWAPGDLANAAGFGRYSFWFDVLNSPAKSFGEKLARQLEESLQLPRRWLDEPDPPLPALSLPVRDEYATTLMFSRRIPTRWLFSADLFEHCDALDEQELGRLEAVMRAHLGLPPS